MGLFDIGNWFTTGNQRRALENTNRIGSNFEQQGQQYGAQAQPGLAEFAAFLQKIMNTGQTPGETAQLNNGMAGITRQRQTGLQDMAAALGQRGIRGGTLQAQPMFSSAMAYNNPALNLYSQNLQAGEGRRMQAGGQYGNLMQFLAQLSQGAYGNAANQYGNAGQMAQQQNPFNQIMQLAQTTGQVYGNMG